MGITWKLRYFLIYGFWPNEESIRSARLEDEYLSRASLSAFINYGDYLRHGDRFLEPEMRGK